MGNSFELFLIMVRYSLINVMSNLGGLGFQLIYLALHDGWVYMFAPCAHIAVEV